MSENIEVVLESFRAVERRDAEGLMALYRPDVEFVEAPSLPYGGTFRGLEGIREGGLNETWLATWGPLQPTEAERSMDPRVIAANDEEVVVQRRHRAVDLAGERFDRPVVGLFRVRDGKIARAQMFHFDTAAVLGFLAGARERLRP